MFKYIKEIGYMERNDYVMKNTIASFEKLDFDMIFDLVKSGELKCYEYYIEECFDIHYQQVLDSDITSEYYRQIESKIIGFIKELAVISKVRGITSIFSNTIKQNYTASKSLDYYDKMKLLEDNGKIEVKCDFSYNEVEIASIIATRGIGQTLFLFRELDLVIFISDLHGILLFYNNSYIDKVIDIALSYDVLISKI